MASAASFSGKVESAKGDALVGVTITAHNGVNGTTTSADGAFTINNVEEGDTLHISYLGYEPQDIEAAKDMKVVLHDDVMALNEVVVTTQKRVQSSIDVPASVSALLGSNLERLHIKQSDEYAQYIPGLQVQIQSPNNPGYVIRGVTSDSGESTSQPRVSVFQDGVSISRSRASVVEIFDMERVEVVKGPQGTLFGRGAEIGAIHYIRQKPTDEFEAEVSVNYGSYNQRGVTGILNTPISDKVSNRIAVTYDAHDGYIDNTFGGDLNGKSAVAVRNSTRIKASDKTTYDLVLDYQNDNYPGTSFKSQLLPAIGGDASPFTTASLEQGENLGIKRQVGGATFSADHKMNDAWSMTSISAYRTFESDERFDADGSYLPLLDCREEASGNQFSQEFRFNYDNGGKFKGFVGASYFYENSNQEVTINTDLQYTYPMLFASSVYGTLKPIFEGAESSIESTVNGMAYQTAYEGLLAQGMDQATAAAYAAAATADYYNTSGTGAAYDAMLSGWFPESHDMPMTNLANYYGDLTAFAGQLGADSSLIDGMINGLDSSGATLNLLKMLSGYSLNDKYSEQSTNYGRNQAVEMFADGTYEFTDKLSLTGGLRLSYENQRSGYSSTTATDPLIGTLQQLSTGTYSAFMYNPTEEGEVVYESEDYLSWVGRLALSYRFGRNNLYASVSRGRRPGVVSFNGSADDVVKLDPETILSYELGIKGATLGGRLGYELSTYYYDWNNFQTSRLSDDATFTYVADDAGRAHTLGVETSLRYILTRNISLFGNYSYIDGRFNETDENGVEQEYAGNRFRLTPEHSGAIGINVNVPLSKTVGLFFTPTYTYQSDVFFEDSNDPLLTQDGYGLLNYNLGVHISSKKCSYELSTYAKNILGEEYLIDAGNSGNAIGMPTFVAGAPAIYGVQFKIGF